MSSNASRNRTGLVTGATRGIGREIARQLSVLGFRLFVTGRDPARLEEVRRELSCSGGPADLSDPAAVLQLYDNARQALGQIDVLVNNAGFNRAKTPAISITASELDESYAVNVRAPILLAGAALKEMGAGGSGHIVQIISSIVHVSAENYGVYTAMKHALDGFTGCLIKEARTLGVKVTAVYPGGVNTGFRPNARPDYLRPDSAARMIVQCITAPDDVVVHQITYRPMIESNF
jgi:short-subunit dehydrogenase